MTEGEEEEVGEEEVGGGGGGRREQVRTGCHTRRWGEEALSTTILKIAYSSLIVLLLPFPHSLSPCPIGCIIHK